MKIILMRHGETIWNKEHRLQGQQDIPLAETGVEQIRKRGEHFAGTNLQIDHILSSPLQRAHMSAEIIAKALSYPAEQIISSDWFKERSFGICEGYVYNDAMAKFPDGNYPGMETLEELYARARQAIQYCEENYPNKTILVVSHGGFIKALLGVLSKGEIRYFDKNIWINNGDYCTFENGEIVIVH